MSRNDCTGQFWYYLYNKTMLSTIKLQKTERDFLLSQDYIEREVLVEAKKSMDNQLIKVLMGPRRAGKSVLGLLMLKQTNFAYLNFDDEQLIRADNYNKLLEMCEVVYPGFEYLFLDEVQNLPKWELWVNKLLRRGYKLVITGSNANLLGGELATHLTGRYQRIEVWPMSYSESKIVDSEISIYQYLINGGYPEVLVKRVEANTYLQTLFESILLKDIVKRFRVRQVEELYNLAKYLMGQFASLYSYRALSRMSGVSVSTAQKYVRYLEETYMFLSLPRFDFKYRKQLGYNKKMYVVDTGMVAANTVQNSKNWGRLLENMVVMEWVRRGGVLGRDLFYYKTKNNKEVDLLVKKGSEVVELVQIAWEVNGEKTWKREVSALIEAGKELGCSNLTLLVHEKPEKLSEKVKVMEVGGWVEKGTDLR